MLGIAILVVVSGVVSLMCARVRPWFAAWLLAVETSLILSLMFWQALTPHPPPYAFESYFLPMMTAVAGITCAACLLTLSRFSKGSPRP